MNGTHLKPSLHPLSQTGFYMSQRPPASQQMLRRQKDLAESIEDDGLMGRFAADITEDDLCSSIDAGDKTSTAAPAYSTPLTISSPMLSLGTAGSKSSSDISETWGPPTQQSTAQSFQSLAHRSSESHCQPENKPTSTPARVPLSYMRSHTNLPASNSYSRTSSSLTPLKSTIPAQLLNTSLQKQQQQHQQQHQQRQKEQQQIPSSNVNSSPLSQAASTWRPMSAYRQPNTPKSTQPKRPLLSQIPGIPSSMVLAQAQPTPGQQTPTKRMRKESRAMAEFRQIASEAVSAYRMWWHCLNSESSSALISSRPTPGLRIRVFSAQHIVQPHLFCVKADILEVAAAAACDGVGLQPGQSLNVLLSFAVCMDALPQVARRMVQRIQSIAEAAHGDQLAFEAESVDIAVYWPWRVQGNQQSILASRFYIE